MRAPPLRHVSTSDQNLDGQRDGLEKAGAGRLFADLRKGRYSILRRRRNLMPRIRPQMLRRPAILLV